MDIKIVEDKPIVIHKKKRVKLHVQESKKGKLPSDRADKKQWKESATSGIKVSNHKLKTMAVAGAKAAARELEGGEELADSMEAVSLASLPVLKASEKASLLYRKRKRAKREMRRKNRMQKDEDYNEPALKKRQYGIKKKSNGKSTGEKGVKENTEGKKGKNSEKRSGSLDSGLIRDRMMNAFLDRISTEEEYRQDGLIESTKKNAKAAVALVAQYIISLIAPYVGTVLLVIVVVGAIVTAILAVIYNSPLALFFPPPDTGTESPRTVLCEYYKEFNEEVMRQEENGVTITYQNSENGAPVSNFNDTLMVYMVKYGTGQCGLVMDEEGKKNLKEVFDEMNYMDSEDSTMEVEAGASLGDVVVTAYCPCVICCGQYSSPEAYTASGKKARARHTIAVDAYNPIVPMGTEVIIEGITYTVEDTGDLNAHGTDFDIFYPTHEACSEWGKRTVEAFLAEGNENTVTVSISGTLVHNLTFRDYISLKKLTDDQNKLLTEMMNEDLWDSYYDVAAGSSVADLTMTKVGCHYDQDRRYEEGYYDCSSLVQRLYKEVGIELPATASTQGEYCYKNAMLVNKKDLKPGDLIFYSYKDNGEFRNISHVAIYVGDGKIVHAANKSRGVVIDPIRTSSVVFYARPY